MRSDTDKIQVRVPKNVSKFLRAKAKETGMPLTELAGALLAYAAQAEAQEAGEALILPTVRQVIRQELQMYLERTFDFQVRTYMEAGTARRMVQAFMLYNKEIPLADIRAIEDKQWAQTWTASRRHFDELLSLQELYKSSAALQSEKRKLMGRPAKLDGEDEPQQ